MSIFAIVLLAAAAALLVATEWSRIAQRTGVDARKARGRARRKSALRVVRSESDEFARSVERDLDALPTIDEDARKRQR